MKVKHLHLQNYGRFKDLKIDFAPTAEKSGNVTVIVGNNGAGKSHILQALATSLSWFVSSLKTGKTTGSNIDLYSIRNDKNEASIKVITDFGKDNNPDDSNPKFSSVRWVLSDVRDGRVRQLGNNFVQLNALVKRYRNKLTHVENFPLPLLVFYSIERAILQYAEADKASHGYDQLEGYYRSLDGASIDFSNFLRWFRNVEDIENEIKLKDLVYDEEDIQVKAINLMKEMNYLYEEINSNLNEKENRDTQERYQKYLIEMEDLQKMTEDKKQRLDPKLKKLLTPIRQSIRIFTGFENIHIRRQGIPTMIVAKDGEELDVNQLSQGEKSLLALVGDIARRLALLNPNLDNPLEGEGVVMIDEVDLHLHPKWQHDLIDKLVKTFPNVQFILTTHSPHVISDNPDILVYALDDGELTQVPNVYGEDVNTVLTKVFDVPIRDKKAQQDFDKVAELIYEKDFKAAENYIVELEKKMPENLELLRCRLHLTQAQLAEKQEG